MNECMVLEVSTHLFGLGAQRSTTPVLIELAERMVPVQALLAAHVRAEVARAQQRREGSLALHYMLADDLRAAPQPASGAIDLDAELARAYAGLRERRFLLVVDGTALTELDQTLALTERSQVSFVRLLPLIGG
jgi:hypothetical protein